MASNVEWLQKRVEHYRANKNDMCEAIEEMEDLDKLGLDVISADPLEEHEIGDGVTPRLTFVKKNLSADYKNNSWAVERVCWLFCLELSRNAGFKPWSSWASASHQSWF
jgi:hypothetical protein